MKKEFTDIALINKHSSPARLAKVGAVLFRGNKEIDDAWNADIGLSMSELEIETPEGLVTKPEVIHAEERLIGRAAKNGTVTNGCGLVVTTAPCFRCARLILVSGIKSVYYIGEWWDKNALKYLQKHGVKVHKINETT